MRKLLYPVSLWIGSIQRANGKYKDHLVGQLTTTHSATHRTAEQSTETQETTHLTSVQQQTTRTHINTVYCCCAAMKEAVT